MGCGSSSEAHSPGYADDDKDFTNETNRRRVGGSKHHDVEQENDFFEVEDAGEGEKFMSVKPWIGQVAEPTNHNENCADKPDVNFELEYVYGYRCADTRQNVHFNSAGNACYMTAALGVVLDHNSNTQKFFGGGEVDNASKQTACDANGHTNDIMCISLSDDRTTAATGQVGSTPVLFTWDACSGEKKGRAKLPKGSRGVNAVAFSSDCSKVACVDLANDHNVYVYNTSDMSLVSKQKGDQNKIHDIAFSKKDGCTKFATAGSKHFYFWDAAAGDLEKKKGIYSGAPQTSFSCVCWDADGICYTGGANSKVYIWNPEDRTCSGTIDAHKNGFICSIVFSEGRLFTGGKDGQVCEIDIANKAVLKAWDLENPVRAVDFKDGNFLVGLRNGTIWHKPAEGGDGKAIMSSHNDGEIWGLETHAGKVITSGDDNQVIFWDPAKRCKESGFAVSETSVSIKRGASTLSSSPASQQSRSVAVGTHFLAVSQNNGPVTIRNHGDYGNVAITLNDPREWNEVMAFSPDQTMLAVGSHDNFIYVYNTSDWSLKGKCKGHSSYIMALDWSKDNEWIRTNCGAYELLFFKSGDCSQDPSGRSNT